MKSWINHFNLQLNITASLEEAPNLKTLIDVKDYIWAGLKEVNFLLKPQNQYIHDNKRLAVLMKAFIDLTHNLGHLLEDRDLNDEALPHASKRLLGHFNSLHASFGEFPKKLVAAKEEIELEIRTICGGRVAAFLGWVFLLAVVIVLEVRLKPGPILRNLIAGAMMLTVPTLFMYTDRKIKGKAQNKYEEQKEIVQHLENKYEEQKEIVQHLEKCVVVLKDSMGFLL